VSTLDVTHQSLSFHIISIRQCIPMEVAVAFNRKYGRHCIPLQWNPETNETEPHLYEACSKKKCRTCKLRIPTEIDANATINSFIQIENKHRPPLDLTRFYNKCIRNLPSNLTCPSCRCTDKRTLVLSTYSYPAEYEQFEDLAFTPYEDDEQDNDVAEPQRKKQRVAKEELDEASSFAFPPSYEEVAIPSTWRQLDRFGDPSAAGKHAIAIHCVSCQKFGMVAPATPCCNSRFPCHERGRLVTIAGRAATIGGVFVRRKCSNEACRQAVSCEACSRAVEHPIHDEDAFELEVFWLNNDHEEREPPGDDVSLTFHHKTRCQTCNLRYCEDCTELSTTCCQH
jgi:hypothetical protein